MPMTLSNQLLHNGVADLMLDYIRELKMDQEAFESAAVEEQLVSLRKHKRLTHAQYWDCLDALKRLLPDRDIGIEIGASLKPAHLGVLGYLLLSSSSLIEALQQGQRFMALLHQSDRVIASIHNDSLHLQWTMDFGKSTPLSDEIYFSGILKFIRLATGIAEFSFESLQLTFQKPKNAAYLESYFQCPITFNAEYSEIILPLSILSKPLNRSDPDLRLMLEKQAQALIESLPVANEFNVQLQQVMMNCLQRGSVTIDDVAQQLAISRRTLHRRLSVQSISFGILLRQVREQLAKQYLTQTNLSLTEISLLLGYAEHSVFSRAFKQWTGQTPRHYRQRYGN